MNILLSSAGRRSYLVIYFKKILQNRGSVICTNSIAKTSAMSLADKSYLLPYVYEKNYLKLLLEICKKEKIKYLFSLHDLEGPILSKNKILFEEIGTNVVISDPDVIDTCLDKFKTFNFLKSNNILTPNSWISINNISIEIKFPLIVKPRFGFGSTNQFVVNNLKELEFAFHYIESTRCAFRLN